MDSVYWWLAGVVAWYALAALVIRWTDLGRAVAMNPANRTEVAASASLLWALSPILLPMAALAGVLYGAVVVLECVLVPGRKV